VPNPWFLYFVDRASRHRFLLITNLMHFFMYLFIYSFHLSTCFQHQVLIIRRSNCINTSSGMISPCDCSVCLNGIPSSHLHRLIIPDDVLTQFDLLMMITWCSKHAEMKWINIYLKECIGLVINKNPWFLVADTPCTWHARCSLEFVGHHRASKLLRTCRPMKVIIPNTHWHFILPKGPRSRPYTIHCFIYIMPAFYWDYTYATGIV
jgi:hypothetical protein